MLSYSAMKIRAWMVVYLVSKRNLLWFALEQKGRILHEAMARKFTLIFFAWFHLFFLFFWFIHVFVNFYTYTFICI
jgi:hypothetical protein